MSNAVCVVHLNVFSSVISKYFQTNVVQRYSPSPSDGPVESRTISDSSYCQQSSPPLRRKQATNHKFALNLVPVQPLKLVEPLGFMRSARAYLAEAHMREMFCCNSLCTDCQSCWDPNRMLSFCTSSDSWRNRDVMITQTGEERRGEKKERKFYCVTSSLNHQEAVCLKFRFTHDFRLVAVNNEFRHGLWDGMSARD